MRQGVWLGAMLCMLSACMLSMMHFPAGSLLFFPLFFIGVPTVLIKGLVSVASRNPLYFRFPVLWMSGIVQFIAACLICSLATGAFLISHPGFLKELFHSAMNALIEAGGSLPPELSNKEDFPVPSPMQYVGAMFWSTSFFGSIFSMILALILPHISYFRKAASKMATQQQ